MPSVLMLITVHKTKWAQGRGGADGGEERRDGKRALRLRHRAQSPCLSALSLLPLGGVQWN